MGFPGLLAANVESAVMARQHLSRVVQRLGVVRNIEQKNGNAVVSRARFEGLMNGNPIW